MNPDKCVLRTQRLARNQFLCIQCIELQTPTASNVNSDSLYCDLLRFPSSSDSWEDRILQLERHTEEKKKASGKKDSSGKIAQRNWNPFPLGRDSLVPFLTSYLMSLRRIRHELSLHDAWQRERSSHLRGQSRPCMTGRRVETGADRHYCQNEPRTRWDGSLQWSWWRDLKSARNDITKIL